MQKEMIEQATAQREEQHWNAAQANAWRARTPAMPLWLPVSTQGAIALLLLAGSMVLNLDRVVRLSLMSGVIASLIPSLLCVTGYRITLWVLTSLPHGAQTMLGLVSIIFWELVKLVLSVALLILASRLVAGLHWPAMVLAFVVVVKAYWLAFIVERLRKPRSSQTVLKTSV